ncbi:GNAT family N-acetyltransferase [Yoonia sp.]|uniref:GNAT family N-acetyltransferase n=1 Tax=Yoonia sp. TaxID=2212373 RepID=UPI0023A17533|nr:GNAT family N-acetyltransferase [Yoonia sp.]MDE0849995.1 GNAT family N-acetyltransferase [Yoonia sp.]
MTVPSAATLYDVIDATWPAAFKTNVGPWVIRTGLSGGSRVSATTARQPAKADDLRLAETKMRALDQSCIFMIRDSDAALDVMLANAGYEIKDPVSLFAAPISDIATTRPPPVTSFQVWPPLHCQREIWEAGGVDAARIAIMDRATCPKSTFLGRAKERPAGTVYAGISHGITMLHALEITEQDKRQGLGRHLTRAVAFWGQSQGASHLALLATKANVEANALYTSLGMQVVGQYHYRIKPD